MYKRKPKNETTSEYAEAVKEFNELNEKLNEEYIGRIQQGIVENPAEFWSYAKTKKKTATYPREMMFGERKTDSPQEVVEMFADYFEGLYTKDEEPFNFDDEYGDEPDDAWNVELSMSDIDAAIEKLDAKGGAGPDNIPPNW